MFLCWNGQSIPIDVQMGYGPASDPELSWLKAGKTLPPIKWDLSWMASGQVVVQCCTAVLCMCRVLYRNKYDKAKVVFIEIEVHNKPTHYVFQKEHQEASFYEELLYRSHRGQRPVCSERTHKVLRK